MMKAVARVPTIAAERAARTSTGLSRTKGTEARETPEPPAVTRWGFLFTKLGTLIMSGLLRLRLSLICSEKLVKALERGGPPVRGGLALGLHQKRPPAGEHPSLRERGPEDGYGDVEVGALRRPAHHEVVELVPGSLVH